MEEKAIIKYDRNNLNKLKKFQLPNSLKKFDWVIFGVAFIALFLTLKDKTDMYLQQFSL